MKTRIKKKTVNQLFKKAIRDKGMKQVFVAGKMGIGESHLSNILDGRENLLPKHIESLNEILGTKY